MTSMGQKSSILQRPTAAKGFEQSDHRKIPLLLHIQYILLCREQCRLYDQHIEVADRARLISVQGQINGFLRRSSDLFLFEFLFIEDPQGG